MTGHTHLGARVRRAMGGVGIRPRRSMVKGAVAAAAATAVFASLLQVGTAAPASASERRPGTQSTKPVTPKRVMSRSAATDPTAAAARAATPAPVWPAASTETVAVPAASGAARSLDRLTRAPRPAGARWVAAGVAPVGVAASGVAGAPTRVRVGVQARAAATALGLQGLLLTVRDAEAAGDGGAVDLRVDYSQFASAGGGDWASRLRMVRLPDCALTTPKVAACQVQTPVPSTNDFRHRQVGASLVLPPASGTTGKPAVAAAGSGSVYALVAAASGPAGNYTATSLASSSSWQVSEQTGAFSWSYPMRVPPTQGGPSPSLAISYNSQAVDGRTASTNNQPSWIGEGHDLTSGFIERSYTACMDDMTNGVNTVKTGDLCWKSDNASIVWNGHSTELVKASTSSWRMKDDDGTRITRAVAPWANGDAEKEYWLVTDTSGTKYYFGYSQRYAADTARTNSVWTAPVAFNQTGEVTGLGGTAPACARHSTYLTSFCTKAWRWNLDYVVDTHGNTLTYNYGAETNRYGQNNNKTATGAIGNSAAYVRGGYLSNIEYGERVGTEASTTAPQRVSFVVAERCLPSGTITCSEAQFTTANAASWPDVPIDRVCTSTTTCPTSGSPTFFSRKRLTRIQTMAYVGTAYAAADTWTLGQSFPNPGDGTSKGLWLASVTHAGNQGTLLTLPAVTFTGVQRQNRVDGLDSDPPFIKWRLAGVRTESGGQISVNYSAPGCTPTTLPAADETNTRLCFPQYWTREGASAQTKTYFNKYVVTSVVASDLTGGGVDQLSSYDYLGTPAWHYDDSEITPTKWRAYSDWRGYARVRVRTGDSQTPNTAVETAYLRGMNGDRLPGGTVRNVSITDRLGTVTDSDWFNGFARETSTYNGMASTTAHGSLVSQVFSQPWASPATATDSTDSSRFTGSAVERTYTVTPAPDAAAPERVTQVTNTMDGAEGFVARVDDEGDLATAADDRCTLNTYAHNPSVGIYNRLTRAETLVGRCSATFSRPGDVVSDVRSFYDGSTTWGGAPTKGDVSQAETLASYSGTTPVYQVTARTVRDANGRPTGTYDAKGSRSTVAYTPATGGPVTSTTTTNALGHASTSVMQPLNGLPTSVVDPNGKRTDLAYDALGRLTAVWLPGRDKATTTANLTYGYTVSTTAPNVTTSRTLRNDGSYTTSTSLLDGLLRVRLTQPPASGAAGGRLLTESVFDSRGLSTDVKGPYYATGAPDATMYTITDAQIPSAIRTSYDGAGRVVVKAQLSHGVEKWRTATSYGGDRISTTPPAGATPTTTFVDGRGQTTRLLQYKASTPTGAADTTTYGYAKGGQLAKVTDPAGNQWTYDYDMRGRRIATHDPDKGDSTATYDELDQPVTTTDNQSRTLATTYDALGRRTSLRDGSATGQVRSSWAYDSVAKGQQTSATRTVMVAGVAKNYVQAVGAYDDRYQPTATSVTIPDVGGAETALAGTYTTTNTYNLDGGLATSTPPRTAGAPPETMDYGYDALGNPDTMGGYGGYVADTVYSPFAQVTQLTLAQSIEHTVWLGFEYDEVTGRLARSRLDRETAAVADADIRYAYDPAGNVKSDSDASPANPTAAQTRCYTYDYLQRMTQAWTTGSGAVTSCGTAPSASAVGGPAPFWDTYTFDLTGNRTSSVSHSLTGAADTSSTYSYPTPGTAHPHALQSVTTTAGTGAATNAPPAGSSTFGYDSEGNTTTRTVPSQPGQTLAWDVEGHLSSVTAGTSSTSYLYDADGNRLIRREPDALTLTLGGTELRVDLPSGAKSTTRYYGFAGRTIAVRKLTSVRFLASDPHGSAEVDVNAANLSITRRPLDPFGNERSTPAGWMGDKGFVGGTKDTTTGLTHLGAREYDPTAGRFISVDPIMDPADPQQLNGYAYASNAPATQSDPDGLMVDPGTGGGYKPKATSGGSRSQRGNGPSVSDDAGSDASNRRRSGASSDSSRAHSAGQSRTSGRSSSARASNSHHESQWDRWKQRGKDAGRGVGNVAWDAGQGLVQLGAIAGGPGSYWVYEQWGEPALNDVHEDLEEWGGGEKSGWYYGAYTTGLVASMFVGAGEVNGAVKVTRLVEVSTPKVASAGGSLINRVKSRVISHVDDVPCSCFVAGTKVATDHGKVAVEKIKPGVRVWAKNLRTGSSELRKVTALFHKKSTTLMTMTLASGVVVVVTQEHPFMVDGEGWVMSGDLKAGDRLAQRNGDSARVARLDVRHSDATVYNFTVAGDHNYYVTDAQLLVHNCPSMGGAVSRDLKGLTNTQAKKLLKGLDTEPHAFKLEYVGKNAISKFDIKMGPGRELFLVNKDGKIVISTGRVV